MKKNFKCEICDESFSPLSTCELKRYMKRVHSVNLVYVSDIYKDVKEHKCDICEKSFPQQAVLKGHMNYVHSVNLPHLPKLSILCYKIKIE